VAGVLHAGSSASGVGASYGVGAVALLLRPGPQAGRVRTDVGAEQVLLLPFRHG
jgi:hypothetical protein